MDFDPVNTSLSSSSAHTGKPMLVSTVLSYDYWAYFIKISINNPSGCQKPY